MNKQAPKSQVAGADRADAQNQNAKNTQLDAHRSDATEQALTTNHGVKISDNQNSLKAGARGSTLLEDFILREKITHFDHERIPERIVHARGGRSSWDIYCISGQRKMDQGGISYRYFN